MSEETCGVKIVLLGDDCSGKTSIVSKFTTGTIPDGYHPTVGAAFITKSILVDDCNIEVLLWDTAGQEVYRGLAPMYYRSAKIAIIVFDITNYQSFESVSYWLNELQKNCQDLTIVVCGNKTDLEYKRVVQSSVAQSKAAEYDAFYIETSAVNDQNINELFVMAIKNLHIGASSPYDDI